MKFKAGVIVKGTAVDHFFNDATLLHYLRRHLSGDWGDLDPEDAEQNNLAIESDRLGIPIGSTHCTRGRILSAYKDAQTIHGKPQTLWIITEWNRQQTTLLLPEEY